MASPILISSAEALAALHGAGVAAARLEGAPLAQFKAAASDSRKVGKGDLFVALPGEKVDGHDYLVQALEAGASCLVVSEARWPACEAKVASRLEASGASVLVVPDTLKALQVLARERRRKVPGLKRIGITGSSGKTTTKEITASILSQGHRVAINPGNLNSDIGLSLSMFGIGQDDEYGVFEMGMNRKGEMGELAWIYEPDLALITNVGTAHIGILGSREAIALEKKQIFSCFNGAQLGLVREDEDCKAFLKEGVQGEVRDYGPGSLKGFTGAKDLGLDGYAIDWEGLTIRFPLVGRHNLANALAAMTLATCVGTQPRDVAAGLEAVRPLFGRSEILRGEVTVLRDCYNANPDSSEAAIEFCDALEWPGRRIYVIGSMLELGGESEAAHARVGKACGASKASALYFFGDEARPAFEAARAWGFSGLMLFETDFDRLAQAVKASARPGDLVLLKASRGMALERLGELLQ